MDGVAKRAHVVWHNGLSSKEVCSEKEKELVAKRKKQGKQLVSYKAKQSGV
jgi:hypothetical protein